MDHKWGNSRTSYFRLLLLLAVFVASIHCKRPSSKHSNNPYKVFSELETKYQRRDRGDRKARILPRHNACAYENKTYPAGKRFRPDPCTHCHCPRHGGRVQCFIKDCRHLANCIDYRRRPGQCCGTCEQVGCRHSNGQTYMPGEVVDLGPCEKCQCPLSGGKLECDRLECSQVACVNPVKISGECCEICPRGPNCWLGNLIIPAIPGRQYRMDRCNVCECPRAPIPYWMKGRALQAVCYSICS